MKYFISFILILVLAFGMLSAAEASQISVVSVTGNGTYNNSLGLLTDGNFPGEGGQWQTNTVWWNGTGPYFTFDLGAAYLVEDLLLSVDNNDSYAVSYSADGVSWGALLTISSSYGEVGWGMDTMSTVSGQGEYIYQIDFSSVVARYLRIVATGGDNMYSVGEFQVYGSSTSSVPLPGAVWLLGSGLIGLVGLRRKRQS